MSPSRARIAAPDSPTRKGPHSASSSVARSGAACLEGSGMVFRSKSGRPKLHAELSYPIENAALICNILRTPEKREKIFSYLRRLRNNKRKAYDPRNAARLIAQGLHWPQVAVELVIQGKPEEMDEWLFEFRLGLSRADAAVQRYWERKTA
jgi:hypothetical protein